MKDLSKKIEFDKLSQEILQAQQKLLSTNMGLSAVGESLEDCIRVELTDDEELLDSQYEKKQEILQKLKDRYEGIMDIINRVRAVYPEFVSDPFGDSRSDFESQKLFADRYLTPRSQVEALMTLLSVRQVSPDRTRVFYDEPVYNSRGEVVKSYDLGRTRIPKDDKITELGDMEDRVSAVVDSKGFNDACVFEYEFICDEIIKYAGICDEIGDEVDSEIYNGAEDRYDLYSYLRSQIKKIREYDSHNKGKTPVQNDYEKIEKNKRKTEDYEAR